MVNDKSEEVGIIYGWCNIKNGKWYIGQTIHPEARFKSHIYHSTQIKNSNHFYRALRKYGLDNFVYCVLEENILRDNLNMKEQEWIEYYDSFHSGYNLTLGGDGAKGVIMSEETRRKLSESHKGKLAWNSGKHGIYSEETLKKLSKAFKGRKAWNSGKTNIYSEETLRKISQSNTNPSKETRRKMSESHKGQIAWNCRAVSKYDLNGNFIKTYPSITKAQEENPKCGTISAVCRGKVKQSGGFLWKYA